jgi:glutamyl-tRNA reductase
MRIQAGETYEQWADRVRRYEYGLALTKIAKGIPVEAVMERMTKNITQKMLHPVFAELRDIPIDQAAFAASKKSYEETYINKVSRAADHVDD